MMKIKDSVSQISLQNRLKKALASKPLKRFLQGANHSTDISYTFPGNPIVSYENPKKSFCFDGNLVRFLQGRIATRFHAVHIYDCCRIIKFP